VDKPTEQLIVAVESLKLRLSALEEAVINLSGFSKPDDRVVFERKVEPVVKEVV
jgi:hypothetical protein